MADTRPLWPGLALCAGLGTAALLLGEIPYVKNELHLGALLLVILLGMAIRSLVPLPESLAPGIALAQKPILRWGVALLGFRLALAEIAEIGAPALVVVAVSTLATLLFGVWLARLFRLDEKLGLLLGVGSAICGASAIVAADSVVGAERRHVAASLGVITLLGTIGIVLYPLFARLTGLDPFLYAVWTGASLHEMAQVVAAGQALGEATLQTATVVKLARICLLAPIVFTLAWTLRRPRAEKGGPKAPLVPWFLLVFLGCVLLNSTGLIPKAAQDVIQKIDLWLLCVGMAGVGLQTGFRDLKDAGWRAILVGALQWLFLAGLSLALALTLAGRGP